MAERYIQDIDKNTCDHHSEWETVEGAGFRVWLNNRTDDAVVEVDEYSVRGNVNIEAVRHAILCIYRRALSADAVAVHSALICRDNKGILLVAPSGTGKTTCCERVPPPWRALCDDQALVVRVEDNSYHAHPFPTLSYFYRGAHLRQWTVEESVELKGICFLKQADHDDLKPMSGGECASNLHGSARVLFSFAWGERCLSREHNTAMFDNVCALAKALPAYKMDVSLTGEFWLLLEQLL
jgi:SynChlorMet cassette protein ScmC